MKFAVDANFISKFQCQRLGGEVTGYSEVIEKMFSDGVMVLDNGGHCQSEWEQTVSGFAGLNLLDWLADHLRQGGAELVTVKPLASDRKTLVKLGLPSKDHKWFVLCRDAPANFFLTEDIDFFDPRLKTAAEKAKRKARLGKAAPVKKLFRKSIGCDVLCCEGAAAL